MLQLRNLKSVTSIRYIYEIKKTWKYCGEKFQLNLDFVVSLVKCCHGKRIQQE